MLTNARQFIAKFAAEKWGQAAANQQPDPGVVAMATVAHISMDKQYEPATVHWLNTNIERGKTEVFSRVARVSPGLAAELLRRNPHNRVLKWKRDLYAADMKAGRWALNGEPVIISKDGLVNDGQNRMHAIIDANICVDMLFVFGVERETRVTVDQGVGRSAGDYLGMRGVKNAHNVSSIALGVMSFEAGNSTRIDTKSITNAMALARYENDWVAIDFATDFAIKMYKFTRAFAAPKIIGTAFYILSRVDANDAVSYLTGVCEGENIKRGQPAFAAREALINAGRVGFAGKLEMIFRGWVAYRTDRPLKLAKVLGYFPAIV